MGQSEVGCMGGENTKFFLFISELADNNTQTIPDVKTKIEMPKPTGRSLKSLSDMVASPSTAHTKTGNGTRNSAAARSSNLKDAPIQSIAKAPFDMLNSASKFVNIRRNSSGLRVLSMFWGERRHEGL